MENKQEPKYKIQFGNVKDLQNERFNKSNNFMTSFYGNLHINEIRIINSLLYVFDSYNNKHKKDERVGEHFKNIVQNSGYFRFKLQDLLNLIRDNRNLTITDIKEHLENIRKTSLRYVIYVEKDGKTYKREIFSSFLSKFEVHTPKDLFNENIIKESFIDIYLDNQTYTDIFNLKDTVLGYSKMNINLNKIGSKLGLGLYEELTRITPLKKVHKGKVQNYDYVDTHVYNIESLNKIFGTNFKYVSEMKPKILVQYKKLLKMELLKDIYDFQYSKNTLKIVIKRNILKEMFEKEGVLF